MAHSCFLSLFLIACLFSSCKCSLSEYGELTNPEGLSVMTISSPEICNYKAENNDIVSYHYIGRLLSNNNIFGRSYDYGTPYITPLGQKKIIAGMDRGLVGTCIGERRRITIPPHLGYGKEGVGDNIPPDSTLVFYIKLLNIERRGISLGVEQNLESIYKSATNLYNDEKWASAVNAFEGALSRFQDFENKTVECVRQCTNSSDENYYQDLVKLDTSLLSATIQGVGPAEYLLPMLQTSKCFSSCQSHSFTKKDLAISYDTIKVFLSKQTHIMIQWAYNQIGDEKNAAIHNQIYYNAFPDEEMAINNRKHYIRVYGADHYDREIRNLAFLFNTHLYYSSGVKAYEHSQWSTCVEQIKLSLYHYKEDMKRCREFCSATPVSKDIYLMTKYNGIHLAQLEGFVLECKVECLERIELVEGVRVNNLLANLFAHLQYCLYQNDQKEEGFEAALTWRELDFSDKNAEKAVEYYNKQTDITSVKTYKPIREFIELKELSEIEARLLTFYMTTKFPKKQGLMGEHTPDNQNLRILSMGRIKDEL